MYDSFLSYFWNELHIYIKVLKLTTHEIASVGAVL